jgi:cell division protein FtsZ
VNEVMNTVRAFAAEDSHIIFGAVYDDTMGENIRVTVVATGLGQNQAKRQPLTVIETPLKHRGTGTDGLFASNMNVATPVDYTSLEPPAIVRRNGRSATVKALANSGISRYDIPAFLRKQAD